MKKMMIIAILAVILLLVIPASALAPNVRFPLFADKNVQVGNVTVVREGPSPYIFNITYILDGYWRMNESHLQLANSFSGLPQTSKHNAIPGKFANSSVHDPPVSSYSYYQPKTPYTFPLYIAAQADVWNSDTGQGAGAWAAQSVGVNPFTTDKKDWATYAKWYLS